MDTSRILPKLSLTVDFPLYVLVDPALTVAVSTRLPSISASVQTGLLYVTVTVTPFFCSFPKGFGVPLFFFLCLRLFLFFFASSAFLVEEFFTLYTVR